MRNVPSLIEADQSGRRWYGLWTRTSVDRNVYPIFILLRKILRDFLDCSRRYSMFGSGTGFSGCVSDIFISLIPHIFLPHEKH